MLHLKQLGEIKDNPLGNENKTKTLLKMQINVNESTQQQQMHVEKKILAFEILIALALLGADFIKSC